MNFFDNNSTNSCCPDSTKKNLLFAPRAEVVLGMPFLWSMSDVWQKKYQTMAILLHT